MATSKQYINPESAITFADSAQTPTVTITLTALQTVTGRVSAQYDRGASARAAHFKWTFTTQLNGTNIVGAEVQLYIARGDGTAAGQIDGNVGTTDAALASANKVNNLQYLGSLIVDQTTTNTTMTVSGYCFIPSRYISLVVYNATTLPLTTSTSVHTFTLIPTPFEMQ